MLFALFLTLSRFFKNYLFPSTVIKWNKLDRNLRSPASLSVFKKNLLNFIRPPNSCKGVKYLTRLRLGLSHLRGHKFKHSFQTLLVCPWYWNKYALFFITAYCFVIKDALSWEQLMILLFGRALGISANTFILNAAMNYIISTNRLEGSFCQYIINFCMLYSLIFVCILVSFS